MRLLLVTHVFLRVVSDSPRLGQEVRRRIAAAGQTFVSAASIWAVALEARLGEIDADVDAVVAAIERSGFFERPCVPRTPPRCRGCRCTMRIPSTGCWWRRRSRSR